MPRHRRSAPRLRPGLALLTVTLFTLGCIGAVGAHAATLPTGFQEQVVAFGLSGPTAMASGGGKLWVATQGGTLFVAHGSSSPPTAFATLPVTAGGERGLLGVAIDPDFFNNNFVYVYYTATQPNIHNRVSRLTANGDVMVPGSEVVLFDLDPLSSATNHNGGHLRFGPDGKLYVAAGDNAAGGNSQSLGTVLGKILRINSDGTIPTDNPFYGLTTGNNRAIFALGLRNPYTFTFERGTGRMFINDVGQSTWEEIDPGAAGANYGWPTTEGPTNNPAFTSPLLSYGHGNGATTGCAITGGAAYNPLVAGFPAEYDHAYFYGDFCSGWIRRFDPSTGQSFPFATGISGPVDIEATDDGSLLYTSYGAGQVVLITYTAAPPPPPPNEPPVATISGPPNHTLYSGGEAIVFSGSATDPEDGVLSPANLLWEIDFHHSGRIDTLFGPTRGITGGTLVIPTTGDPSPDAFYRITVLANDSQGALDTAFVDLVPRTVNLTLQTEPPGLRLLLDGSAVATPATVTTAVGVQRTLAPLSPQTAGATTYLFQSWKDGGPASRTFPAPAQNTPYTATFQAQGNPPPPPSKPAGVGLTGTYFRRTDLTRPVHLRLDPQVDFDWTEGPGAPRLDPASYSVQWTGQVRAKVSGRTTFAVNAEGGTKLTVNGATLFDASTSGAGGEHSGALDLVAGELYDLRLEYRHAGGAAAIRLAWSAPGLPSETVPRTSLYPYALLVSGADLLTAGETALRDRLTALGFVPLSKRGETVAQVDGAGKALVLLAPAAGTAALGTRLRSLLSPVLCAAPAAYPGLGLTGSRAGTDFGSLAGQSRLRILAPTHPLAAGLPAGGVAVVGAPGLFGWGSPNGNGTIVARLIAGGRQPALFAYERGAAMPGLTAPNRRAGCFLGEASATGLTNQGQALLDAALRWTAGL